VHNRFALVGADFGAWTIDALKPVRGPGLDKAARLTVRRLASDPDPHPVVWRLEGQMSNLRYATRREVSDLRARQEGLGRPSARRAAMIPIKKSAAWWDLAQDERRAIFEDQSRHTAIGMDYLPAIARQLYHCRDLGQPFDFITWFEYAPEHAVAFEDLVARLRDTREWTYIEREVDVRLALA
jgi:hypothetical protein